MTVTCGTQLEGYCREDAEILLKNQTRGQNLPGQPAHFWEIIHISVTAQGKIRSTELYIQHKEKCKFFTKTSFGKNHRMHECSECNNTHFAMDCHFKTQLDFTFIVNY